MPLRLILEEKNFLGMGREINIKFEILEKNPSRDLQRLVMWVWNSKEL